MKSKLFPVLFVLLAVGMPLMAQTQEGAASGLKLNALAMSIASGLCGLAQANAVRGAAEGIARNPGATAAIRFFGLLGLILIESLALYTLVVIFVQG